MNDRLLAWFAGLGAFSISATVFYYLAVMAESNGADPATMYSILLAMFVGTFVMDELDPVDEGGR